jgi:hypothetical protein
MHVKRCTRTANCIVNGARFVVGIQSKWNSMLHVPVFWHLTDASTPAFSADAASAAAAAASRPYT